MAGRYRKLLRAFKREAVQFLVAKNLVISHLPLEALPQPIKLQMRPQDRGHLTFSGLPFPNKNLMLKVSIKLDYTIRGKCHQ